MPLSKARSQQNGYAIRLTRIKHLLSIDSGQTQKKKKEDIKSTAVQSDSNAFYKSEQEYAYNNLKQIYGVFLLLQFVKDTCPNKDKNSHTSVGLSVIPEEMESTITDISTMTKKKASKYRWSSVDKVYILNLLQKIFTNSNCCNFLRLFAIQTLIYISVHTKLLEEESCVALIIPILKTLTLATCVRLVKRDVLLPTHFLSTVSTNEGKEDIGNNTQKMSDDPIARIRTWDMKDIEKEISLEEIPRNIMIAEKCSYASLLELVQNYTTLFERMYEKEVKTVAKYSHANESHETNKATDDISLGSSSNGSCKNENV